MPHPNIAELNSNFEQGISNPPPSIWHEWLWECDLGEPAEKLNKCHLLGLLIARYKALREPTETCVSTMVHQHTRTTVLTPRQLKDVVEDIQMHWDSYSANDDGIAELLDACMTRFGTLNLYPCAYDDVNMRDAADETRMSVAVIRRFVSIFCVLYRHLHLMFECEEIVGESNEPHNKENALLEIHDFHVQASMETFYKLSMHSDLPPASRMLYRQDFASFYHCVSQVVYFHFPSYDRAEQLPLDQIRTGEYAINTLAPLLEMHPEITLRFEDETLQKDAWNWVVMGKRVYLAGNNKVFYSSNVLRLMEYYIHNMSSAATQA
jgi:hypothetical protein